MREKLILAAVAGLFGFAGAVLGYMGTSQQTDADQIATLYDRIETLEKNVYELQTKNTKLEIELAKKHDAASILREFMDGNPHPFWVKLYRYNKQDARPEFRMWHINEAYEDFFDISLGRYIGKTDFQIWPKHIAEGFYKNDIATLQRMAHFCAEETFPPDMQKPDETVTGYVCKWSTTLEGNIAIAGQVILEADL